MSDRIAIVTGGSRGIGRGIALELAKRGATVVINYNASADAANEVVEHIKAGGGQAMAFQADVSSEEGANDLIKAANDAYGKLDILVNNAGTTRDNVIMLMKADDFDTIIQTN
ncbi:MAG: SDR family NAD(P)-dependent oxidoreductase, partial [Anaerolineae bacterium]|nr:SDR family NAD(P)-dependent oxidoreductase [Anaerolineae bacterium]